MPLDIFRIELISFDIDGTLADTDDSIINNICNHLQFLKKITPSLDMQRFVRKLVMAVESPGNSFLHLLDRLCIDELIHLLRRRFFRLGMDSYHPQPWIPGTDRALRVLAQTYPIAIISARDESFTKAFIQQMGIAD
ncbi:MAG: HAD family hydrolase, partial [Anaerolineales bacterium]